MIPIVRLWETLSQSAKSGTSGYQTAEEFNNDIASVQTSLMSLLSPLYSATNIVQDILAPFVVPFSGPTTIAGVFVKPADYFQLADASVAGYPAHHIGVNERAMLRFVPSRRPSSSENNYVYFLESDSINFLPEEVLQVKGTYIRQPEAASIEFTVVETEDSDYITPVSIDDLEWPERAFNLILYMMMQKLGLEMKESLLLEFSNLGITVESSKI